MAKIELKPMTYKHECNREILAHDVIDGFEFYITSLGSHPCAYIHIPETHSLSGFEYINEIEELVSCHGGVTWFENHLPNSQKHIKGKWLGWDYGHCCDYIFYCDGFANKGKKWTTEEVLEEIKDVIAQIK